MKNRRMIRIGTVVVVLILAGLFAFSQLGREKPAVEKEEKIEPSSETTIRHEATPEPTANPTKKPTPVSASQSVYIQRETSPDGRLFEDGYFAVLLGEGGYYNIYDCFGTYIDTFFCVSGYGDSPDTIMTYRELSLYYRTNSDDIEDIGVDNESCEYLNLTSTENGFYQVGYGDGETIVMLFNPDGEKIKTLAYSLNLEDGEVWVYPVIFCIGEETFVCFKTESNIEAIYFVAPDGTINNQYCFEAQTGGSYFDCYPEQLLGRDYYIRLGVIYDLSGKIMMENVEVIKEYSVKLTEDAVSFELILSDYFIKDGKTYNSSLQPVTMNTRDKDGDLIYGAEYEVDGIVCQAVYDEKNHYWRTYQEEKKFVAVGYGANQIAVQTKDNSYTFNLENGYQFDGINNHVILLKNMENESIQMISLKTGEIIHIIHNAPNDKINGITIADEYVLVEKSWEVTENKNKWEQYIIDKDGNIRYFTENAYVRCMIGEYILLKRGPYYGIADLNGEWVLKSLRWEMNRDAEYEGYY